MSDINIQDQINELNHKMDIVLDYVNRQRLKSDAIDDLLADASIIGKDIYDSTVKELENQSVEIDPDELRMLGIKLVKNIKNFNTVIDTFESVLDLIKDAAPIANEMIIDFTKKLHVLDKKGYFEFVNEIGRVIDNIVSHFTTEDIRQLADNVVVIIETLKNLTQPEMLNAANNAIKVYGSIETDKIPEYSIWKLMREMKTPEMKKGLGFMVTFMKNLSKTDK